MSNVVPLRGSGDGEGVAFEPRHSHHFFKVMRDLWMTGAIAQTTFNLGMQVVQRFKETDCFKTVMIPYEAMSRFVETDEGVLLSGLPFILPNDYLTALQELHLKLSIRNHYLESELENGDEEGHFTLDPMLSADVDYSIKTPIIFKFDPSDFDDLQNWSKACRQALRDQFTVKVLTRD